MLPRIFCARPAALSFACASGLCFVAFLAGCGPPTTTNKTSNGQPRLTPPLTVLVVDDPVLGANIKAERLAHTDQEEEITIRQITWQEAASAKRLPGDLIVFQAGQIGELAEAGLLAPISDRTLENDAFALRDIYKQVRLHEMKWGDKVLALPLGSPQLMLVYRADIFAQLKIKPPQTWAEYDALAVRLAKREELGKLAPHDSLPWRGTVEPLAAGYAGQVLLARAAAYAAHKEQISPLLELSTLKALIGQPPYVRALKEMAAGHGGEKGKLPQLTPAETYQEIAYGHCAMAITWPTAAVKIVPFADVNQSDKAAVLGFAELPGASEVYDFGDKQWAGRGKDEDPHVPLLAVSGRMVSVTSTSGEPEAAENMATWLAGSEVSAQISPGSPDTSMFRTSQEPDAGEWLGSASDSAKSEYVAVLRQIQERPQHSQGIRLPGRREYLSALDLAVMDALHGQKSPEDALTSAAAAWDKITARRGLEAQRAALERSLGLKKN